MISHDNGPYLLAEANPGTTVERQEHEGVREQTLLALVDETIRVELACVGAPKLLVCVHHQEPVWNTSKIDIQLSVSGLEGKLSRTRRREAGRLAFRWDRLMATRRR